MYDNISNTMSQENNSNEIAAFKELQKSYTLSANLVLRTLQGICTLGVSIKSKDSASLDKVNIDLGLTNQRDNAQNEISTTLKEADQSPVANSKKERVEEITRN